MVSARRRRPSVTYLIFKLFARDVVFLRDVLHLRDGFAAVGGGREAVLEVELAGYGEARHLAEGVVLPGLGLRSAAAES